MRRMAMGALATAAVWAAMVGGAGAATTTPGPFRFVATDGGLVVGTSAAVDVKPVVISGTVDGSGHLRADAADAVFPSVTIPVPATLVQTLLTALASSGVGGSTGIDQLAGQLSDVRLIAGLSPVGDVTGSVDPATGAASLTAGVRFGVTLSATAFGVFPLNIDCGSSPIPFTLGTTTVTVPGTSTALAGAPFSAGDGTVALTGTSQAPAPSCTLPPVLANLPGASDLLGPLTGALGPAGPVGLRLSGRLELPAASAPAPVVTVATPVGSDRGAPPQPVPVPVRMAVRVTLVGAKQVAVPGTTVPVRIACSSGPCAGTVRLTGTGRSSKTLGSARYAMAAGATRTLRVPLGASARTALRKAGSRTVRAVVTVTGGIGDTRALRLTAKQRAGTT